MERAVVRITLFGLLLAFVTSLPDKHLSPSCDTLDSDSLINIKKHRLKDLLTANL
ncbi:hypothetical protein PAMP_017417 [Pampus punctatissimus]